MLRQFTALALALLLTAGPGASRAGDAGDLSQLLAETNAAHAQIDAPRAALDAYRYDFDGGGPLFSREDGALLRVYDPASPALRDPLPAAEARAEAGWLLRLLRTQYGPYVWAGGDGVFGAAEAELLAALPETGTISLAEYRALLIRALSFIGDTHLSLDGHSFAPDLALFADESRDYYRKDGAFYTDAACTDRVRTIDGQDPAAFLKRAVGQKGELTWYLYRLAPRGEALSCQVRSGRGTYTADLHPAVSLDALPAPQAAYTYEVRGGVPVAALNRCVFGDGDQSGWTNQNDEADKRAFLAAAGELKGSPAAVLDLSRNPGGNGDLPPEWFLRYTGRRARQNYCTLRIRAGDAWLRAGYGAETEADCAALRAGQDAYHAAAGLVADGAYYTGTPEPQFLENPGRVLFVLTSRATASAAESFTDLLHNLENTVTIGANTAGCLTGAANYALALPYSGLSLQFGECLFCWEPSYFREGAGLEPDVYLTGDALEQRLDWFLTRYAGMVPRGE